MTELIIGLIAPTLGIVLSPLAIMALIAELLSRRFRVNGLAYLLGWLAAVVVVTGVAVVVFAAVSVRRFTDLPEWLAVIRLLIAVLLLMASVWVFRRGTPRLQQMQRANSPGQVAAAAPQLPGWLRRVEHFTPVRSFGLGFGIFAVNPVDASCAVIAGLDIATANVSAGAAVAVSIGFVAVAVSPIAVPVLYVIVRGAAAAPLLAAVRTWTATHTNVLNAALILVIGVLQLQKAVAPLVS